MRTIRILQTFPHCVMSLFQYGSSTVFFSMCQLPNILHVAYSLEDLTLFTDSYYSPGI